MEVEENMATLKKCDGCETISPDADGVHIANYWFVVDVVGKDRQYHDVNERYLLCGECMKFPKQERLSFLKCLAARISPWT